MTHEIRNSAKVMAVGPLKARRARINLKEFFFSQTNHMQVKVASFFEMFCYILDKETDTKRCFDHNKTLFVVI